MSTIIYTACITAFVYITIYNLYFRSRGFSFSRAYIMLINEITDAVKPQGYDSAIDYIIDVHDLSYATNFFGLIYMGLKRTNDRSPETKRIQGALKEFLMISVNESRQKKICG